MLNFLLGGVGPDGDGQSIETVADQKGHAVYGPYETVAPGRYAVVFELEALDRPKRASDPLCAVLEVAADQGRNILASRPVRFSELAAGRQRLRVEFVVERPIQLEYRVWVSGDCPLRISDNRAAQDLDRPNANVAEYGVFPEADATVPAFFRENVGLFRGLYDHGGEIGFDDDCTVVTIGGISFYVRCADDVNFVGEVLFERVYHFVSGAAFCVIDVGMNIGLSALTFAANENVREVYGFEPFAATYNRAIENIALNPTIADKIRPYAFGLSDADWSGDLLVGGSDSGAQSVVAAGNGAPVFVTLKDGATTLRPILTAARANGLRTMMKIDCEGSEFRIFDTLARDGLFDLVDALAVEWHAMFPDKSQLDLFAPLHEAGFMIFDRSPRVGNGFFYAVRMAAL